MFRQSLFPSPSSQNHLNNTPPGHLPPAKPAPISSLLQGPSSEQSFPDPRGCEYREVEVTVSGVWGGQRTQVQTRGWVLPAQPGLNSTMGHCWNGVLIPSGKLAHQLISMQKPPLWFRRTDADLIKALEKYAQYFPPTPPPHEFFYCSAQAKWKPH